MPARPPSFWPIGDFEVRLEDAIVHVRSSATFNYECVKEYAKALTALIGRLPPAFALYSEFDAPPVMDPESARLMAAITKDAVGHGLRAVAFVTRDGPGRAVAHAQWARMYEALGVPHGSFDARDAALAWLGERLG